MNNLVLRAGSTSSTARKEAKLERSVAQVIEAELSGPSSQLDARVGTSDSPGASAASPRWPKRRMKRVRPWSDAWLSPTEQVVLRLIHVDPRLTVPDHVARLRDLVTVFLPAASRAEVKRALKDLHGLQAAGAIDTNAFVVGDRVALPELPVCRRMFNGLVRASQEQRWPAGQIEREWPTVQHLLGQANAASEPEAFGGHCA
ncbi:hypothetical protein [Luteibacter sp. CQ10]|uniref:hypothetical protein n=1 Tax=Luteibacter sp. CQ10 TaxID=2805821 RepID=UPI0034A38567